LKPKNYLTNKEMSQVKITQIKSTIKRPQVQKATMKALGLGKINRSVVKDLNPAIEGMIRAVNHMIVVENI
jgi:large subunit ribosomal protein L30